jgi:CelD/BcsL family acetyltransferase involved in cellulose biosynthesis
LNSPHQTGLSRAKRFVPARERRKTVRGRAEVASSSWVDHPVPLWLNAPETAAYGKPAPRFDSLGARGRVAQSHRFIVEGLGFEAAAELTQDWADLVSRALEPNVFMEPGFALTAAQHLARADRPIFLVAWDTKEAGTRELVALWVLLVPSGIFRSHAATLWRHKQSALGVPLIDAARADAIIPAIFTFLAETFPRLRVMSFPRLVRSGPIFGRLLAHALESGLEWRLLDQHERAILTANAATPALSKHRRDNLARQRRQLEKRGAFEVRTARTVPDIREATEAFLSLEESGWKGARQTALLSDSSRAAFVRTMTRRLGAEGKCRIDALTLNGKPIAMGIVLRSRDRAFYWKTAYDEALAAQSPGVQLSLEVSRIQQGDATCQMTDSCADADHPMIDRLWSERLPIVDLALPLSPAGNDMLAGYAWRATFARRLRKWVGKRLRRKG